jgi:hypothetical protein
LQSADPAKAALRPLARSSLTSFERDVEALVFVHERSVFADGACDRRLLERASVRLIFIGRRLIPLSMRQLTA